MLLYKGEKLGFGVTDLTKVDENLNAYGINAPKIGKWSQGRRNKSITEIEDNLVYVSSDVFEVMEGDEITFTYNAIHTYIYINYFNLDGTYKDTKYVSTNSVTFTIPSGVGYACAVVRNDATGGITPETVSDDCSLIAIKKTVSQQINNLTAQIQEPYATLPNYSDLNDLKTNGTYYLYGSYSYANRPTNVANGYLQVLNHNGSSAVKQILYRIGTVGTNDQEIYERTTTGTTWGDWVKVATTKDLGTQATYSLSGTKLTITTK